MAKLEMWHLVRLWKREDCPNEETLHKVVSWAKETFSSYVSDAKFHYYRPQTKFAKVMFLHVSVCPWGGWWYPGMHCRWYLSMPCSRSPGEGGIPACLAGFQAHTQGGSWGVWPGGLQAHTLGGSPGPHLGGVCVSQHALRQTPRWLLLRTIRILLECILVCVLFQWWYPEMKSRKTTSIREILGSESFNRGLLGRQWVQGPRSPLPARAKS